MLIQIQRELRKNPTVVVMVTVAMWWSLAYMIAYSVRHTSDRSDIEPEMMIFGTADGDIYTFRKKDSLRQYQHTRRQRYYDMMKVSSISAHNNLTPSVLHSKGEKSVRKTFKLSDSQEIKFH